MPYEVLDSGSGRYEVLGDAPVSVQAGAALNSLPRQLGLTARYGLEGLANSAQVFTEPVRMLTDKLLPDRQLTLSNLVTDTKPPPKSLPLGVMATALADYLGLPKPETANERVVGDASRLVAGTAGMGGLASLASKVPGLVGQAGTLLSSNMGSQLTGAAGAGLAGGASREAGGSPLMQGVAAFGGGIAGGMAPGAVTGVVDKVKNAFTRLSPQDLDLRISAILQGQGIDYSQLPAAARASLRQDLQTALQAGQELNPEAVRRLADFRAVGATPTRGMVSQNPVQITREQNLAKIGANSSDEGLQGLALLQNRNNSTFIDNLNQQGATRGNVQTAGEAVNGAILGRQAQLRAAENAAWTEARNSPGYRQPIQANVISDINAALGDQGMMPFLNPTISRYMEAFQTGQQPFTPQAYRNLQSMLSNELSRGGNEAAAAGVARRVLEQSDLRPITNPVSAAFGNTPITADTAARVRALDAAPGQSIDAVNQARAATRAAYAYEDSSPLVRSVLSDGASGDPMRIARRFVIGGTPNEAATLAQEVGDAGRTQIRDALVAHLKEKALNGATDEVGKFSQAAYNKALREIGDRKLSLFFSPEEVGQLRALGRVSSYATVQPVGSAVNNSNSGALLLGKGLDALSGLAQSVPVVGPMVAQPVINGINGLNVAIRTRQAQNVYPGLLASTPSDPAGANLLLPALTYSGSLLSAP